MKPALFRKRWGFGTASLALSVGVATPALAQAFQSNLLSGAAPVAIAAGALAFGVLASMAALGLRRKLVQADADAHSRLATMRAQLDEYEALLSAMPEVTAVWQESDGAPRIFGDPVTLSENARNLLDFRKWLTNEDASQLGRTLRDLRISGQAFDLDLSMIDGRQVRALGRATGGGAALRLRLLNHLSVPEPVEEPIETRMSSVGADRQAAKAILSLLQKPAWVRDGKGKLIYANAAYRTLVQRMGIAESTAGAVAELFAPAEVKRHVESLGGGERAVRIAEPLADYPEYELVIFTLTNGTAGYLGHAPGYTRQQKTPDAGHIGGIIEALATPVAVFDGDGKLQQFNRAYDQLWGFDDGWLQTGVTEKQILDKLRSGRQLPSVPDYQAWREEHLKVYDLQEPAEHTWHLPNGRTVNFVAAPASREGGVIYVFEDVTERLKLESTNKALVDVQRETLAALSEAVAVFYTDGRLRLFNPRLSEIWKLPTNLLSEGPHIDRITQSCDGDWPEDGLKIWQDLKRIIVDLSPNRIDTHGRFARSDGRLIDYAAVRLPDGQTMLTFSDVTESASYERMLKERNNALLTADRLKDAFVQNVSYELRSPLTNIIGFADLLASDSVGPLNERQRLYTDYIRASSATLGLLVDNILDLTHVDAGIAELELEPQDVPALIERAKAGLLATLTGTGEHEPPHLVVSVAPDLPPFIADGKRVVQVLYNLLSNAAKFCDPGADVYLTVDAHEDWLRFVIEDNGVGVPEEIRAAMFQRFEGQAVDGRQRGAGLGLSIVKAFVQLHGGSVNVEPRKPRGTRVVVNLPQDAARIAAPAGALDV